MNQELRSKLTRIIHILRAEEGSNSLIKIEQVFYLIYLKLLDEEESRRLLKLRQIIELKSGDGSLLYPRQSERYRWSNWQFESDKKLHDFVSNDVFSYMASLVKEEPQIAEFFRDAVLEIDDPTILGQLVDEINKIEFTKLGTDEKGEVFEFLLTELGELALIRQIQTPRQIRKFMVEMVDPDLDDTIFDPACGTGAFLTDSVEYILAKHSTNPQEVPIYGEEWFEQRGQSIEEVKKEIPALQTYLKGKGENIPDLGRLERIIYGFDVSRQMVRLAMMNLVFHGVSHSNVKRADSLIEMSGPRKSSFARRFDVILSQIPFGVVHSRRLSRRVFPGGRNSEMLFLGIMMEALAPGGRCAVIVPEYLLFSSMPALKKLRREIVEDYHLLAVVSLPSRVLDPYSNVKSSVLVFQRDSEHAQENNKIRVAKKVWFYKIRADGFDSDRKFRGKQLETPKTNDIPDLLEQWAAYKNSGFRHPSGIESGTLLDEKSEEPRCWWTTIENISESGYNLTATRYKPQIASRIPDDPTELIRETLAIEREISSGLNKLLKVVENDK